MNSSRRSFLGGLGGVGAAAMAFNIVPSHILRSETAPSNTLTRGVIGFGGIANSDAHLGLTDTRLLAVCDVDRNRMVNGMKRAKARFGWDVDGYRDFRRILERPDIDVVHICTPPHWHGVMSVMAAQAGKDIWCEKPMTRTIGEGKKVIDAVNANKRIFRLNTWFRMHDGLYGLGSPAAPLKKAVINGMFGDGPLRMVVGEGQGFSFKAHWTGKVFLPPQPVPAELDYDLWLGPAPLKPYNSHRVHNNFRGYWDYDGGGLGDMGQHYLDPMQYIIGKDDTSPVRVDIDADPQHPDAVGTFRRATLTYADGTELILDGNGSLKDEPFLASKDGTVKLWKGMRSTIPNFMKEVRSLSKEPDPQDPRFLNALKSRKKFPLNEMNGHRSCTIVNLVLCAMRAGRGFNFDPVAQISDDAVVNRFIDQPMRAPWQI